MTFPYTINVNIPNAPNDPADDQPEMKTNYANIDGFLKVDHVAAGTNPGAGFHKQVRFFTPNIPIAIGNPTESVAFTADAANLGGNATNRASPIVQQFYRNQNGIFPVVGMRAFATIATVRPPPPAPTPQNILNAFNVASVSRTALGVYEIVLQTDTTNNDSYAVLVSNTRGVNGNLVLVGNYAITNTTTFVIEFFLLTQVREDPVEFSFSVLQT